MASWYEQSLHFEQDFMDNCANYFDAQLRAINFENSGALPAVNDWVNEKTQGKIETILDELPHNVVMILLNAIYFKGIWTYQFDSTLTVDDWFRLSDGSTRAVRMMTQKVLLPYSQTDEFQAIDLPYGSGDFRMTIFLPQNGNTIDGLIEKMTPDLWGRWIAALEADSVTIQMPRFKLEYKLKMNDVLTAMGMGVAFDRYRADFSGMCLEDMIWIDQVMHKSFIEVNEQGTEAAAATAVVMVDRAVMDGPPVIRIDHPFLLTIRESKTNTMLFIGAVEDPGA